VSILPAAGSLSGDTVSHFSDDGEGLNSSVQIVEGGFAAFVLV